MTIINNTSGATEATIKFNSRIPVDLSQNITVSIESKNSSNSVQHQVLATSEDYYYSVTIPDGLQGIHDDSDLIITDSNNNQLFRDRIHFTGEFTEGEIYKPKQSQVVQQATSGDKYITY